MRLAGQPAASLSGQSPGFSARPGRLGLEASCSRASCYRSNSIFFASSNAVVCIR
jgi:hypothetical protein